MEAEERFSRFFESWFAHVVAQRGMGGAEVGSLVADAEAVVDAYRSAGNMLQLSCTPCLRNNTDHSCKLA